MSTCDNVAERLDGVVIGVMMGFSAVGAPLVVFTGNPKDAAVAAKSTCPLSADDIGCEVALLFESGDPLRPLVIGRLLRPDARLDGSVCTAEVRRDGEIVEINAEREIVLRCGLASITLTRTGKVLIRGAYISSWSSGAHRIKGGSVNIN